jgi:PAS domain S-box-containing protein
MQEFYFILALLTAGVSLAMGSISLVVGLKNRDKTEIVFGVMVLSLFAFVLLPPVGFIIQDQAPYPLAILIKRLFSFTYYALLPWFVFSYTGSDSRKMPILISVQVIALYIMMAFTQGDLLKPTWMWGALIIFGTIFMYGLLSGIRQYKSNERAKGRWLLIAMSVFGFLLILAAMNQAGLDFMVRVFNVKYFSSFHLHALFLVFIMGLRIVVNIDEKFQLEKKVQLGERRLQALMQYARIFIMELDKQGTIKYINPFGVKLLDYSDNTSLKGRNWFDTVFTESEARAHKKSFIDSVKNKHDFPYIVNSLQSRSGNTLVISWTHFLIYTEDGEVSGMVCIGIDSTNEESANKLITQLKLELEKEKIVFADTIHARHAEEVIGNSDAMGYVLEKAKQVAKTSAPVLLEGETGVGKELIADLIHKNSLRNRTPMIKVNCGALPKELIEDELFGHEKGAFTSAIQFRKGRFELADGGTVFLDEIGELPLEMQPKLLRVLQNGEFERVGGEKTIKVDVRIIAATNRELQQEVQQGRFRDDLFYRLNVFPITIPAVRKRKEDLPLLINHFIRHESKKYNKQLEQISKADMQRLMEYTWPGNVRELKNVIERSVISSEGNTLKLSWFLSQASESVKGASDSTLEEIERQHIIKIMEACHWKINGENGAAEKLDMHPNTLRSKMKKLDISRPAKAIF